MDEKTPVQHLTVAAEEAGQKLSRLLERRFPGLPGSFWMRAIRTGQVRLDGKRAKPFDRVEAGQDIRVPPLRQAEAPAPAHRPADLDLLQEPDGVLVIRKPAGLPTQPGSGHGDSIQARLAAMFAGAAFAPAPAHRLDKDTSGLVLAGATYQATRALHDWIARGALTKLYLAWVEAALAPGASLDLDDTLAKSGPPGSEHVAPSPHGKPAHARARCLATRSGRSLLELELLTGRTHQLRVQLASRSLPIAGDRKYGTKTPGSMRLHAWKLVLPDGRVFTWLPDWDGEFAVEKDLLR